MNRSPARWRRVAAPILLVAAMLMLALSVLSLYASFELFDADRFGDRAISALETDEGRALVGATVADGIIARDPDLIGARPLLEGASEAVATSAPFEQVLRSVVVDLHRTVFGGDRDTVALKLADVGVLVIETLQSVAPRLAADVPKEIEPRLVSLSSGGDSGVLVDGARIAKEVEWLAVVSSLLFLALLAGAIVVAPDRRRMATRAALAVAGVALLLVIAYELGRALAGARFDDPVTSDAARVAWDALLSDLRTWSIALAVAGLVVGGAAASLLRPLDAGAGLRRAYRAVADTPARPRARAARAALLIAAGIVIVAASGVVLRVAVIAVGALALYVGVGEVLRLALPPQERQPREQRRRAPGAWRRPVLAGVMALAAGVVVAAIAFTGGSAGSELDIRACNGSPELCDRPIDEIAFAATHNSMSAADQEGWLFSQHERAIPSQLDAGIRGLLIDTHDGVETDRGVYTVLGEGSKSREKLVNALGKEFVTTAEQLRERIGYEGGGDPEVYLCHAYCEMGATKAETGLRWVRDFLVQNPYEVLVISIEDDADADDAAQAFEDSDLLDYVWRKELDPAALPTPRQMIDSGGRAIVMVEDDPGDVPWMHSQFELAQETPFSFDSPAQLAERRSCRPNRGGPDNPLLLLNHWVDTSPAPRPSNAKVVNARGFLLRRARECERIRGRMPNLVAVDFYEEGDVTGAVEVLNGVASP